MTSKTKRKAPAAAPKPTGRPSAYGTPMAKYTIRMTEDQIEFLKNHRDGSGLVRRYLDGLIRRSGTT